jgi:hypothetical protein
MSFKQFASCEPPKKKENEETSSDSSSEDEDPYDADAATFYVTVSLIEGHTDATDSVFEHLQYFLKPYGQDNRYELHFDVDEDELQVIIEGYGGDVKKLIKNFANWMLENWADVGDTVERHGDMLKPEYEVDPLFKNLMEELLTEEGLFDFMGKQMISYTETTESVRGTDKVQNWLISLTDYGLRYITVVEAENKKQQEYEERAEQYRREHPEENLNDNQRGWANSDSD